jgi:hypothetical protein
MMPFYCSYRNKNEPSAIYPSFGYSPPPGKKISKCDDAPAMTLVVQWWLFLPFDTRGRVIFLCRVTFHSAHFTNDRHWDHIPILLQYCGSCPRVHHDPYLPSISASLQTPGRAELATILTIPLLFQESSPLSFTLSSQRLLEVQKKKFDSERYHQSSHPCWDPVHTHKSRPLPPFPSRHITSSLERARL